MLSWVLRTASLFTCSLFIYSGAIAQQFNVQHQQPTTVVRGELTSLEFLVPGINQNDVQEAILFYRYDEAPGYQQSEISFRNGVFDIGLMVQDEDATTLEYYFQLNLRNGQEILFPENDPTEAPVRVEIVDSENSIPQKRNSAIDFTILSPEPGDAIAPNDVVIAIALFYDESQLEPGEFRLYIDDRDVTELADTSDYFISYVPKDLQNGTRTIRLDYVTASETFLVEEWDFDIVDPSKARTDDFATGNRNRPIGSIELGARSQNIAGNSNDAYTARSNISGSYGVIRYSLNGFFTSQESNRLQPQNRYGANIRIGNWFRLGAGHVYPNLSRFTIDGRRVFGLNSELRLLKENFNIQFIYGEINRKVTNLYEGVTRTEVDDGTGNIVDTTYALNYQNLGKGTFTRKITAGRVAFGNEQKFQLGFHAMKVEDDTTSIFNIRDYDSLLEAPQILYNNLTFEDRQKLSENPDLLGIQNGSVQARGNFVAGTDLRMGLARNRIQLRSETVVSALNTNIYGGPLTVQRADDLGFDIEQGDADLLASLSRFIIVNENMNVLPIRIKDFDSDSAEAEPFFPTSLIGSNSELSINYPANNFKLQYRWVGPNFSSLANSTIRKDIAGFTATDRFRLLQNRVYVTLGFETLEDNVTGNKDATTKSNTYRTNISWYPVSRDLPRVSAGFRFRTRENGVNRFNPYIASDFENASVQNFVISNADTLLTPVPKENTTLNLSGSITQQFEWLDIIHDASLSFNNLNTKDEVFAFGDVKSSAVSFNISSRFNSMDLRTQLGITINNTETGNGQTDIRIFGIYTGASYFLLDRKLNLNGRLALTSNTSTTRNILVEPSVENDDDPSNDYFILSDIRNTSDFGTFVIQAGAQYDINDYHSFIFDANFTNVSGAGNANDSIVSLRYLFNF